MVWIHWRRDIYALALLIAVFSPLLPIFVEAPTQPYSIASFSIASLAALAEIASLFSGDRYFERSKPLGFICFFFPLGLLLFVAPFLLTQ